MASSSSLLNKKVDEDEKPHVLAVDDSFLDLKLIERLLTKSAFKVTTADNGQKALDLLGIGESKINLIITDYCMPGMNGYELLKKIKETATLREIPVVILSSENVPARIKMCMDEGAEEFMLKPLKQSDVMKLKCFMMQFAQACNGGRFCFGG